MVYLVAYLVYPFLNVDRYGSLKTASSWLLRAKRTVIYSSYSRL